VGDVLVWGVVGLMVTVIVGWLLGRRGDRGAGKTAPTEAPLSWKRRLLFQGLFAVLATAMIAIPWMVLFSVYRDRLHDYHGVTDTSYRAPRFPGLIDAQIVQLGWAQRETDSPETSYLRAARQKPSGTRRIGIFGGSYVEGLETAHGHDLCTFLQRDLRAAGLDNVEVLNFGVRSYGIHQAYLMWLYLGRQYDLDYAVFFAFDFHAGRDDTFLFDASTYGPLHARFALEGNELRMVPVAGKDRVDASRRYHSMVPTWRYLRYDSRLPVLLRALVPWNADARLNPFYYGLWHGDEILESYRRIFRALARESPNTVVVTQSPRLHGAFAQLADDGVHVLLSQLGGTTERLSTPYKAPRSHRSALGNEINARELSAWLRGMEAPAFDVLDLDGYAVELPTTRLALDEVAEVELKLGEKPLAGFALRNDPSDHRWRLAADIDFEASGTESLLMFDHEGRLIFLPLPFAIRDGEPVELALDSNELTTRIPLGTIETENEVIGRLDWSFDPHRSLPEDLTATVHPVQEYFFPGLVIEGSEQPENASLWIAGQLAMRGTITDEFSSLLPSSLRRALLGSTTIGRISFTPVVSDFIAVRGRDGHYVELDSIAASGTVDWSSRDADGRETRFPLFSYRIGKQQGKAFDPRNPNPLTRTSTALTR
jgi:hypothetical protein